MPEPDGKNSRFVRFLSVLLLAVAGMCFWRSMPADMRSAAVSRAEERVRDNFPTTTAHHNPKRKRGLPLGLAYASGYEHSSTAESGSCSRRVPEATLTRPIEEIRIGQRVLAHNPEVSDEERSEWQEPDWSTWQLLQLEMPKPDGSLLKIEMLRPAEWLDSQAALLVESREIIAHPGPPARAEGQGSSAEGQTPSPVAKVAKTFGASGRSSSRASLPLDSNPGNASALSRIEPLPLVPEVLPVGVVAEMDLPELGLTDLAWVTDIADAPEIETGDGRVVTATFHHSSGDVIDLTVEGSGSGRADSQPETIGTTSNHPFWSVDRQEYVQAGQLEPGERVLTFSGDTKRIAGKLPRPGPQPVYNLEVHAEHVYFVGEDGLLVHNAGNAYTGMPTGDAALGQRLARYKAWKRSNGLAAGTRPTQSRFRDFARGNTGRNGAGLYVGRAGFHTHLSRAHSALSTHGNSLDSDTFTYLYRADDLDGHFLKWGITNDLNSRYSDPNIVLTPIHGGQRRAMSVIERSLVETNPGPLNREPWRGARLK